MKVWVGVRTEFGRMFVYDLMHGVRKGVPLSIAQEFQHRHFCECCGLDFVCLACMMYSMVHMVCVLSSNLRYYSNDNPSTVCL